MGLRIENYMNTCSRFAFQKSMYRTVTVPVLVLLVLPSFTMYDPCTCTCNILFFQTSRPHTLLGKSTPATDDLDPKAINSTAAAARCTATSTNVQACSSDVMSMTSHSSHVHSLQSQTTDIRVIIEHMQIPVIQLQDRHAFPLVSSLSILFLLLEWTETLLKHTVGTYSIL